MKLKYYTDPGHGWVAVKRKLLTELGIADRISYFSYQKGNTVYLEEDCDLSTLITALQVKHNGIVVEYDTKHTNNRHPIRNYESYRF